MLEGFDDDTLHTMNDVQSNQVKCKTEVYSHLLSHSLSFRMNENYQHSLTWWETNEFHCPIHAMTEKCI